MFAPPPSSLWAASAFEEFLGTFDLIKPPVVSLNPSPSAPPLFVSAASARYRPAPVQGSVPDRAFILEPLLTTSCSQRGGDE